MDFFGAGARWLKRVCIERRAKKNKEKRRKFLTHKQNKRKRRTNKKETTETRN
jgi:hypothetical protein